MNDDKDPSTGGDPGFRPADSSWQPADVPPPPESDLPPPPKHTRTEWGQADDGSWVETRTVSSGAPLSEEVRRLHRRAAEERLARVRDGMDKQTRSMGTIMLLVGIGLFAAFLIPVVIVAVVTAGSSWVIWMLLGMGLLFGGIFGGIGLWLRRSADRRSAHLQP